MVHVGGPGIPWVVHEMPDKRNSPRAVTVKLGNWLGDSSQSPTGNRKIPYIDSRGKFSGCTLYTSNLSDQSYLATVIATVARRLHFWARRHNRFKFIERSMLETIITKVSSIYTLTKNSYFLDRILALMKNFHRNKKPITGLVNSFASKLDVYKGFIYSQACKHAHWLTSRAARPRDKSSTELFSYHMQRVGISNLLQMKTFIEEAIYVTVNTVSQIGSIVLHQLEYYSR